MLKIADESVRPGNNIGLMLGIMIAEQVFAEFGIECIITSLNDKRHSRTSLHYADQAVDFRSRHMPSNLDGHAIAHEIKSRCSKHYDVIYEGDHFHLEFQPRGH
ncbi:MAG: hypothetical protein R3352_05305 [Salinisphaeraceae bacterium]|nr:hypothetical protein [Salinisphaeraceae bacterium]